MTFTTVMRLPGAAIAAGRLDDVQRHREVLTLPIDAHASRVVRLEGEEHGAGIREAERLRIAERPEGGRLDSRDEDAPDGAPPGILSIAPATNGTSAMTTPGSARSRNFMENVFRRAIAATSDGRLKSSDDGHELRVAVRQRPDVVE